MNFLAAHECTVDFREFRTLPGEPGTPRRRRGCRSSSSSSGRGPPSRRSLGRGSRGRTRSATACPGSFLDPILKDPRGAWVLRNERTGGVVASTIECAFDSASRRKGLLGRAALHDDAAIIIAPCNSIHTFFMRFSIDVAFVARDGHIVRVSRAVSAWRIARRCAPSLWSSWRLERSIAQTQEKRQASAVAVGLSQLSYESVPQRD